MRALFVWLFAIPWTCLFAFLSGASRLVVWRGAVPTFVGHGWGGGLLRVSGLRLRIENEPPAVEGGCVYVANHSSMLDIWILMAAFPFRFRFVSRPFFFKVPVLGWGMWFAGMIPMDPKKPRAALGSLDRLRSCLRRGDRDLLFPEGTRSPDGSIRKYKRGPFLAAIDAGVPVVPVRITGAFEHLPKHSLRVRSGEIRLRYGEPMPTEGLGPEDARKLAAAAEAWTRGVEN